jgi:hypothetical protein
MKRLFATTVFAVALALLLAITGRAAMADDVQIKSVDNYAGNSNVYTNRPNTTVTITHADGESWTGTTDSEGKITIQAGYTVSKESLKIKLASGNQALEGIVVPDSIHDRQPFSFSAPQVIQGEVVSIQTADGVVVQRSQADKYGRTFLAAGLPAGAYFITRSSHGQPLGKIEIQPGAADALERPGEHPPQPLQLRNLPPAVKLNNSFSLTGNGFSPNCADMQVSLSASDKTEAPMVLAATEDQLKLAPVQQLQPGSAQLRVTNKATGHTTDDYELLLYDIQGNLVRRAIKSGGDQTQLVVRTKPENVPLKVKVSVASGPVDFGGGHREAEAVTGNGRAIFPVHAEKGAGPFQLNWELVLPVALDGIGTSDHPSSQATATVPQDQEPPAHRDCHCDVTSGGGIANLKAEKSDRLSPKQIKPAVPHDDDTYLGTVRVTFDVNAATVQAHGTDDGHMHVDRITRLTVSAGGMYHFRIFRAGNRGNYVPVDSREEHKVLQCPDGRVTFDKVPSEEYRVDVYMSKMEDRIPDLLSIDVDVSDSIDPCAPATHAKESYQLRFATTSGVKMLESVKKIP